MRYRTRTYYTDAQKALMWERWKQGWTLHQIAQLFNRAHTSVRGVLAQTRGIQPPQRSRSAIALTLAHMTNLTCHGLPAGSIRQSRRPGSGSTLRPRLFCCAVLLACNQLRRPTLRTCQWDAAVEVHCRASATRRLAFNSSTNILRYRRPALCPFGTARLARWP